MKIPHFRKILALSAMAFSVAVVPTTASAAPSIHLDLPGLSIGLHDHHNRHYRKRYKRHHKRYYKDRYRHYDNHYPRRSYRYYDYGNRYYDGGRSNRSPRRYYDRHDRYDRCPTPGYSSYYYRNGGCYSHGDHYHCEN